MVDRSMILSFNYNEIGHFATECKKPRHIKNTSYDVSQKKKTCKAYLAEGKSWDDSESEDEEVGNLSLMAISDNPSSSKPQGMKQVNRVVWILDSGCSRHMNGDRALLSNEVEKDGPVFTFGDNIKGLTQGYCSLQARDIIIDNISVMQGLQHYIISISQFCDKGYGVLFDKEKFHILHKKNGFPALQGVRKGNLFVVDLQFGSKDEVNCFYTKASSDVSWLWHKRLSHLNFKTMNSLVKRELGRGLTQMEFAQEGLCEACQKGKSKKASHKSTDTSAITEPFQLLHMDLFCPVNVMSMSKKRYALVIVDDYSKYTCILFLHSKDETSQMVIGHLKLIELDSKFSVRAIRSDNGTEFKNALLNEFCADKGISRQYSAPRTPQQNGVVERKNRTLIEAARIMLSESKLPMYLWAEVVNTTCYTQNQTLINKDLMKTPYDIMTIRNQHSSTFMCLVPSALC